MSASSFKRFASLPALWLLTSFLLAGSCAHTQEPIQFGSAVDLGKIGDDEITEASGLAHGHLNERILWTHNDSGDSARIFGLSLDDLAAEAVEVFLIGAEARDWEDIALSPGADGSAWLYVGDIGDNNGVYPSIRVHRFKEPLITGARDPIGISAFETLEFTYPDGARDAEGLFVDPIDGALYIVTKRESRPRLYRAPQTAGLPESGVLTFERELPPLGWITAADITRDGKGIILKTYDSVYYWKRSIGESVTDAMDRDPTRLTYEREPQGEAIAWGPDGRAYYTLSEEPAGIEARLYRYSAE